MSPRRFADQSRTRRPDCEDRMRVGTEWVTWGYPGGPRVLWCVQNLTVDSRRGCAQSTSDLWLFEIFEKLFCGDVASAFCCRVAWQRDNKRVVSAVGSASPLRAGSHCTAGVSVACLYQSIDAASPETQLCVAHAVRTRILHKYCKRVPVSCSSVLNCSSAATTFSVGCCVSLSSVFTCAGSVRERGVPKPQNEKREGEIDQERERPRERSRQRERERENNDVSLSRN